nr:slipin family protein [Paludisphaera mucosa]
MIGPRSPIRPAPALRLAIIGSSVRVSLAVSLRPREEPVVFRRTVIVREFERGLLYHHGRFLELLPPGRYRFWSWQDRQVDRMDLREVSQTVEAQEILTADKIGVRVTLIAQYRVSDPIAARHRVGDFQTQLYQDLQLTLREAIVGRTLEELLKERDALSRDLQISVAPRANAFGVELTRVGVKDMVLPGSVRAVFLQEVEADLKGRANLTSARHEVAAARARVNTARMIQDNPLLLKLQELETLSQLASKSGNVLIIPGLDSLLSRASDSSPRAGSS